MKEDTSKWDVRYLELAKLVATWSKDPSTKCGAVIIGSSGQVLSQGYNGFPRGVKDHPARYADRGMKYALVVHAEMNAIYNASRTGTSLEGATMYVWGLPICSECAKGIAQVGIKTVVMPHYDSIPDKWKESHEIARLIFEEAGTDVNHLRI